MAIDTVVSGMRKTSSLWKPCSFWKSQILSGTTEGELMQVFLFF